MAKKLISTRLTGGKKLKSTINKAQKAENPKGFRYGFFSTARYPDGTPVTNVAAWNEFGTKRKGKQHVPERPFFRQANNRLKESLPDYVRRNVDTETLVVTKQQANYMRKIAENELKESITQLTTPANAPSTIRMKGSSNPLIDEGFMRNSVTSEDLR